MDRAARSPDLEWAHRSAAGQLENLEWIDPAVDPKGKPYVQRERVEGQRTFTQLPFAAFLPPFMAEITRRANAAGRPTLLEAMQMVFAKPEWVVNTRHLLGSPLSPLPHMLAIQVEAFGVGQELHRDRPEVLARLAAMLPRWMRFRGTVDRAREILECTGDEAECDDVAWLARDGDCPLQPDLIQEAFSCRSSDWWTDRQEEGAAQKLRIDGGVLRFQPTEGAVFKLRKEDVLVAIGSRRKPPMRLLRLLPPWTCIRVVLTVELPAAPEPIMESEAIETDPETVARIVMPGSKAAEEAKAPLPDAPSAPLPNAPSAPMVRPGAAAAVKPPAPTVKPGGGASVAVGSIKKPKNETDGGAK